MSTTIESKIILAGGSTLQQSPYFSSTEAYYEQVWTVDFGNAFRDWGGQFIATAKTQSISALFRAVRNIQAQLPLPEPTLPDNILDDNCNTPLQGFEWGIKEDWSTGDDI